MRQPLDGSLDGLLAAGPRGARTISHMKMPRERAPPVGMTHTTTVQLYTPEYRETLYCTDGESE